MITFQYVKLMHTNTLQTCNLTTQSLFLGAVLHSSTLFTQPTTKSTSQRPFRLTLLIACLAKQPAKATLTEKILTNIVTHTHISIRSSSVLVDKSTSRRGVKTANPTSNMPTQHANQGDSGSLTKRMECKNQAESSRHMTKNRPAGRGASL